MTKWIINEFCAASVMRYAYAFKTLAWKLWNANGECFMFIAWATCHSREPFHCIALRFYVDKMQLRIKLSSQGKNNRVLHQSEKFVSKELTLKSRLNENTNKQTKYKWINETNRIQRKKEKTSRTTEQNHDW